MEELEGGSRGGAGAEESLREEFTQRLVTMERKFQQALREKEATKKLLEVGHFFLGRFQSTFCVLVFITTHISLDISTKSLSTHSGTVSGSYACVISAQVSHQNLSIQILT